MAAQLLSVQFFSYIALNSNMRIILSILFALSCFPATAQDGAKIERIIKVNPFYTLGGEINLGYEQALTQSSSMEIQGGYIFSDWIVGRGEEAYLPFPNKADGFAFRLAYKKFFSNTAPLGNYISAQALFKRISLDS